MIPLWGELEVVEPTEKVIECVPLEEISVVIWVSSIYLVSSFSI